MKTVLLADLIKGVGISDEVPATGATDATQEKGGELTVAKVASVSVARTPESDVNQFSDGDKQDVLACLESIDETDPEVVSEVLHRCESDPEARDYFVIRSKETRSAAGDDRRHCAECSNLDKHGCCLAALRGELDGLARRYRPWDGLPRRCDCFRPVS